MEEVRDIILGLIRQPFLGSLATVTEDGRPWTRYVMGVGSDDMTIRFSSFLGARKVAQIRRNSEVHITCGVSDPEDWRHYLQIQGRARVTTDDAERRALWSPMLADIFSGPDDPNFAVVIVTPYRIELNTWGSMEPRIWER
jgi:general stress protein 26